MEFEPGHLYHIFNRGINSQKVFFTHDNYLYFLKKIKKHLLPHADILAWCLMPNHFHLLVHVNKVNVSFTGGFTEQVTAVEGFTERVTASEGFTEQVTAVEGFTERVTADQRFQESNLHSSCQDSHLLSKTFLLSKTHLERTFSLVACICPLFGRAGIPSE